MTATVRPAACLLSLALLMVAACSPPEGRPPEAVRTVFTVSGMHCDSCNAAVSAALEGADGVLEASADYTKGQAAAVYRAKRVSAEELKAEIEKLGYTVTAMTTTPVATPSP
ncbi:MAG TPA: heavy-metal-associated domain-containing protein [Thermoanaerobaculales bacterium]|nr:heavy-metal-associated domain-containing protein [Thermoanaerobaculales bacterium]HPA82458.1 heavy-metal-associated domain-containing protein [Thermoanaerobaculales bacterium]HQL31047.1 heavy-metal-associated domain-containing protein [Thermoanaerobaculales bacterium]